jgi:hypothetical protein
MHACLCVAVGLGHGGWHNREVALISQLTWVCVHWTKRLVFNRKTRDFHSNDSFLQPFDIKKHSIKEFFGCAGLPSAFRSPGGTLKLIARAFQWIERGIYPCCLAVSTGNLVNVLVSKPSPTFSAGFFDLISIENGGVVR